MLLPLCATESTTDKKGLFDCIEGSADTLNFNLQDSIWRWEDSSTPSSAHDFAYRRYQGNFILCVQIDSLSKSQKLSEQNLLAYGLGVRVNQSTWQFGCDPEGAPRFKQDENPCDLINAKNDFNVLQIERRADEIIFSASRFGEALQILKKMKLLESLRSESMDVGLFRKFGDIAITNIRYSVPAWKNLVPYQDYLGSRLELLEPHTGKRTVIFQTYSGIEAPNWTPDGKNILFNSAGRIFNFHLASESVTQIETGFALRNNNDHVLSADGKWLAISHHSQDHNGKSIIYKLPAKGGTPIPLTMKGPSYLHGWSPDGQYVIFTAERNGQWDIYRVPTDGSGSEIQLTNNAALDDGSEYSSDGKYIYFNSTRTGTMQIWRMKADGSNQEQLTFDEYQDWFPHLSPDGKTLVFISYQPEMEPTQHPYYQSVYLRTVELADALEKKSQVKPKVIAYLYGGQGTINVPSWSPDGKVVAFVSHTKLREQSN